MKTKLSFIAILLLIAILLGSCTNTPDLPESTEPPTSDNSTDTSTETPEDPFGLLRSSEEEWISYGLAAYEDGKQVANLKEFFSDRANMTYLTLYDHFFTYDKAKSIPVAEALFAFIYEKHGAEAVLDLEKRCEYKSEYLKSLGLEVEYTNAPEVEVFLSSMDFSTNATYKYIISFGNVTYYFKDFGAGSPTQYHGFLYYSTTGLFEMIDYLKSNNLSEGFDTERKFNYYMTFDGSGYSKTVYSNGNMYINDSYSTLHEAVHAMGITKNDNIWLSEGLCNYFGKSLGFNDQIAASYMQLLTMAKQGYFDEQANAGNTKYVFYKRVYEEYIARGGKIDSVNTFDLRLYTDVNAKIELDTNTYETLGYAYKFVNNTDCNAVGSELSYEQTTSLVHYLVDTYGIEKVLDAYHSQDIVAAFGKGYEELKADWLVYLNN
jgi:hypothetical protein